MSRKDFVAIARALNAARTCWAEHDPEDYPDAVTLGGSVECPEQTQWWRTVERVADALAASNGRFDRGRFYAACSK